MTPEYFDYERKSQNDFSYDSCSEKWNLKYLVVIDMFHKKIHIANHMVFQKNEC